MKNWQVASNIDIGGRGLLSFFFCKVANITSSIK